MRKSVFHLIGYTVVAGASFWIGALTRDYLVTKAAREALARPSKFLGNPAPMVSSTTVNSATWNLDKKRGKVVVIEVWATWCGPCVASMPRFRHLYERFKDRPNFMFVGVSLDPEWSVVREFCAQHDMPWEQLLEPKKEWSNSVARAFEVTGVPFTCVVDKRSIVRYYDDKTLPQDAIGLEDIVQKLLWEPDQAPEPAAPSGRG